MAPLMKYKSERKNTITEKFMITEDLLHELEAL
jgi:hypothetical protein